MESQNSFRTKGRGNMLHVSEVLMQNPDVDSFEQLVQVIRERSKTEMFFRIDVKPPFIDTPEDWEDRLEAAFT
jgi:hypothetical protein